MLLTFKHSAAMLFPSVGIMKTFLGYISVDLKNLRFFHKLWKRLFSLKILSHFKDVFFS